MPLRIVKASDPIKVDRLVMCIYAPPGVGKSTLAFMASNPLCLAFDPGVYRALGRKDCVQCAKWEDASELVADDLTPYDTVIVDSGGHALDKLAYYIECLDPKSGRKGGGLSLQGFGILKHKFSAFLAKLNAAGKDVVIVCHMDEQRKGDDTIERLDGQGSSKNEIYKAADAMGRIFVRNGKRYLDFNPREHSFGKNPGQLDELEIPDQRKNAHFLADVIQAIKDKLNEMSTAQTIAETELNQWLTMIDDLAHVDDFNHVVQKADKMPFAAKAHLHKRATGLNFAFDKVAKTYRAPTLLEQELLNG